MGEPERRLGALVAALGEGCSPGYTLSQSLGRIQGESVEEGVKREAKFVEKLAQMKNANIKQEGANHELQDRYLLRLPWCR